MIAMNGHIVAQGSQFSLNDVEVVTATIDIEDVRSHRTSRSRGLQAAGSPAFHRVEVPFALSSGVSGETDGGMTLDLRLKLSEARFHTPEEEIAYVYNLYAKLMFIFFSQTRSSMLALGLPQALPNTRILCASQRRYRFLRHSRDSILDVPSRD